MWGEDGVMGIVEDFWTLILFRIGATGRSSVLAAGHKLMYRVLGKNSNGPWRRV